MLVEGVTREEVRSLVKATRFQVSGYVPEWMKAELIAMREGRDRLSESALVQEGLEIAMPELRRRHRVPIHGGHGRMRPSA